MAITIYNQGSLILNVAQTGMTLTIGQTTMPIGPLAGKDIPPLIERSVGLGESHTTSFRSGDDTTYTFTVDAENLIERVPRGAAGDFRVLSVSKTVSGLSAKLEGKIQLRLDEAIELMDMIRAYFS